PLHSCPLLSLNKALSISLCPYFCHFFPLSPSLSFTLRPLSFFLCLYPYHFSSSFFISLSFPHILPSSSPSSSPPSLSPPFLSLSLSSPPSVSHTLSPPLSLS